jgi:hypothetical protein
VFVVSSLPRFLSRDEENTSLLSLVIQITTCMFIEEGLLGFNFVARHLLVRARQEGRPRVLTQAIPFKKRRSCVASTTRIPPVLARKFASSYKKADFQNRCPK